MKTLRTILLLLPLFTGACHAQADLRELKPDDVEKAIAAVQRFNPSLTRQEIMRKMEHGESFTAPVPPGVPSNVQQGVQPAYQPPSGNPRWPEMVVRGTPEQEIAAFKPLPDEISSVYATSQIPEGKRPPLPVVDYFKGLQILTDGVIFTTVPSGA